MYWTKSHDEACLSFELTKSAELLYRWINRRTKGNEPEEVEIDLKKFNNWVAKKRGRPYDPKTLKLAIAQLLEKTQGLIVSLRQVSWYYYRLVVKPVTFLAQEKSKKSESSLKDTDGNPAWDGKSPDEKCQQQQQNIDRIDKVTREVGLRFDRDALNRIWRLSGKCFDRIMQSIELLLYRNSNRPIVNPHGFLVDCLTYNWQDGFDLYYQPELPKFHSVAEIRNFVAGVKNQFARA